MYLTDNPLATITVTPYSNDANKYEFGAIYKVLFHVKT